MAAPAKPSERYETALRNSWVKWVVRRADNASLALWLSQLASGGKTLAYKLSAACSGYNAYIARIEQRAFRFMVSHNRLSEATSFRGRQEYVAACRH